MKTITLKQWASMSTPILAALAAFIKGFGETWGLAQADSVATTITLLAVLITSVLGTLTGIQLVKARKGGD
ncbi:MAG: phage holin [Streptococcaceae bacterium]|jgi:hypothetical protein|nr:phage holin [Streptococcaceae bacterium]